MTSDGSHGQKRARSLVAEDERSSKFVRDDDNTKRTPSKFVCALDGDSVSTTPDVSTANQTSTKQIDDHTEIATIPVEIETNPVEIATSLVECASASCPEELSPQPSGVVEIATNRTAGRSQQNQVEVESGSVESGSVEICKATEPDASPPDMTKSSFTQEDLCEAFPNHCSLFKHVFANDGDPESIDKPASGCANDKPAPDCAKYDLSTVTSTYTIDGDTKKKCRLSSSARDGNSNPYTMDGASQIKGSAADKIGHIRMTLPPCVVSFDETNGPFGDNTDFGIQSKFGTNLPGKTAQVMMAGLLDLDGKPNNPFINGLRFLNELSAHVAVSMFKSGVNGPCPNKVASVELKLHGKTLTEKLRYFLHNSGDRPNGDITPPMYTPCLTHPVLAPDIEYVIALHCGKNATRMHRPDVTVELATRTVSIRNNNLFRSLTPFELKSPPKAPEYDFGEISSSMQETFDLCCRGRTYNPATLHDARRDGLPSVSLRDQLHDMRLQSGSLVCLELDLWPRPADAKHCFRSGLNASWVSTAILRSAAELAGREAPTRAEFRAI